jgi:hypothetical protein
MTMCDHREKMTPLKIDPVPINKLLSSFNADFKLNNDRVEKRTGGSIFNGGRVNFQR